MSSELLSFVPKALRDALGEEGTDALVVLLNQSQTVGRKSMEQFTSERFERRLVEETSMLREEMGKMRAEFKEEIAKLWIAIADIHKSISSQTRWITIVIFSAVLPIYFALAKLLF